MTRDELIEKAAEVLHGEWVEGGRSARGARALAEAGLLADPAQTIDLAALRALNREMERQVDRLPWQQRDYERARLELRKLNDAMLRKNRTIRKLRGELFRAGIERDTYKAEAAEVDGLQNRLDRVTAVLDRPWPDDEDHHDFVNQQVEDARTALRAGQPAEPQLVFVVIADYGDNGASVLRVYDTHPSETTLKALPTQPSDDAPDSPSAVPGYRGFIVAPAEVEHDRPGAAS